MAGDGSGGGADVFLSFLLCAVMVAVAVVGFFMWDNYKSHAGSPAASVTLNVKRQ